MQIRLAALLIAGTVAQVAAQEEGNIRLICQEALIAAGRRTNNTTWLLRQLVPYRQPNEQGGGGTLRLMRVTSLRP